jgi:uncharacterized membrane protein YbaN (DUF454 family)
MLTVILIATLFYVPFHVGPPVLLAMLYGKDADQRKAYVREILIESMLTMVIALGAFFWLWQDQLLVAIIVMIIMMALPYWRIWQFRKTALQ